MAKAVIQTGITADVSGFKRGIMEAEQSASRFKNGQVRQLGGMIGGMFAVSAVAGFVRSTGQAADSIEDMAKSVGVSAQELQTLQVLAQRSGSSAEYMSQALKRAAMEGVKFTDVAKVLRGTAVEGVSTEVAMRVLGRTGAELNTVIDMVASDGLPKLQAELLATNQIMSDDTVNAAAAMQEAWEIASIGIVNSMREGMVGMVRWIKTGYAMLGSASAELEFSFNPFKNIKGMYSAARKIITGEALSEAQQSVAQELTPNTVKNIDRVTRQDVEAEKAAKVAGITASDSLAKIGGIVGGQTNPMQNIAERQLKVAERTQDILQAVVENTSATVHSIDLLMDSSGS